MGSLACKNEFTNTYFEAQSSEGNNQRLRLRCLKSLGKEFDNEKICFVSKIFLPKTIPCLAVRCTWLRPKFSTLICEFLKNFNSIIILSLSFQEIKSEPLEVEDIHEDMSDSEPDVSDTCFGNQTWTWWRTSERNEKSGWTIERVAQK